MLKLSSCWNYCVTFPMMAQLANFPEVAEVKVATDAYNTTINP
jgi:hypothetical protein